LEQMWRLLEGKSDRVAHPLVGTLSLDLPRPVAGSKHRGLSIRAGYSHRSGLSPGGVPECLLADSDC